MPSFIRIQVRSSSADPDDPFTEQLINTAHIMRIHPVSATRAAIVLHLGWSMDADCSVQQIQAALRDTDGCTIVTPAPS